MTSCHVICQEGWRAKTRAPRRSDLQEPQLVCLMGSRQRKCAASRCVTEGTVLMTGTSKQLVGSSTVPTHAGEGRMAYLDALRVVVIGWVVLHQAAQPYGPTGGDWPITDPGNLEWLGPLYPLGASFGLGLLFLLAGYFVPRSYDRRSPRICRGFGSLDRSAVGPIGPIPGVRSQPLLSGQTRPARTRRFLEP